MIDPESHLWVLSGSLAPYCPQHIFDWDQRRWIALWGSERLRGTNKDSVRLLQAVYYELPRDVVQIRLTDKGTVASVSKDPKDDPTPDLQYPRFAAHEDDLIGQNVLRRSQLQEIDRLGRGLDLVVYHDSGAIKKAVFKYEILPGLVSRIWNEAHIVHGLRGRTPIPAFDNFVVDDVELRLLGYTYKHIAGGETLQEHPYRPFCLSWLEQLTQIVDDLNLKYGVYHQYIWPPNLMIDPQTNRLILLGFERAIQIGVGSERDGENDIDSVIFSMHQILTLEEPVYEDRSFWDRDIRDFDKISEWPIRAELEPGLQGSTIKQCLIKWVSERRSAPKLKHYTEASEPLEIPPQPPRTPTPCMWCQNEDGTAAIDTHGSTRSHALQAGRYVVQWERAPDPSLIRRKKPISPGEIGQHSAKLARELNNCGYGGDDLQPDRCDSFGFDFVPDTCGCGYYDYQSLNCGHLFVSYPVACGATKDEMGVAVLCPPSVGSNGKRMRIRVDDPVLGKCPACSSDKPSNIIPMDSLPSIGSMSLDETKG